MTDSPQRDWRIEGVKVIGNQGSGRENVSVKAKELFGEGMAAKHSVKPSGRSGPRE